MTGNQNMKLTPEYLKNERKAAETMIREELKYPTPNYSLIKMWCQDILMIDVMLTSMEATL